MPENGSGGAVTAETGSQEGLFDVRRLVIELWRWKWVVVLVALIGAAKGVNDARHFSPSYKAQMTVASIGERSFDRLGSGSGLLGAAQSFGLIRESSATATSFDYFKHIIGSRNLAKVLQVKHGFLQIIFKSRWDFKNNTWIVPSIDENSIRQRYRRFFHFNSYRNPDLGALAQYVGGTVRVEADEGSPFFKITVVHSDPKFALFLLKTVYKEADKLLGIQNRRKIEKNKKYVEAQLDGAQLTEVRAALLGVLMSLEQKSMLVNSEPPYSIKILDAPWVTSQPDEPNLTRIIGLPTAVAMIISLAALTLIVSFRVE